jgi:hypothetical protein
VTNSEFLALAEKIGAVIRGNERVTPAEWASALAVVRSLLDAEAMTPAEFDARMKKIVGRRRVMKLVRFFPEVSR